MIYCISDLHACDHGPRDNFDYADRLICFNDFLDWVEGQKAQLMIIGDLFDWWQSNFSASANAYRNLLDRFEAMQATYIVGNHDNTLTNFINTDVPMPHPFFKRMVLPFEQVIGGRKFAFLHGHEVDPNNSQLNPGLGTINTIIAGMLEDRNNSPFSEGNAVEDGFIGKLEDVLSLWQKITFQTDWYDKMIQDVEAYRKSKGADVVISGHTHLPGNMGDYHYNIGTWARQINTFGKIDDEGQVSLWQWKGNVGPVSFEKQLYITKEIK